jgi:hypothetical protein
MNHPILDPPKDVTGDVIFFLMLAAMAALVIYVNITDMKRRSRMTKAERRAEREAEADHIRIRKS